MLTFRSLHDAYGRLLFGSGIVAGVATFLMMVLVVANVALRFLLNAPISGTLEMTESMLTVLVFLSLALTQHEGGHIHVVLVTKRMPRAAQRLARLLAMLLGLAFFAWCTYAAWGFAMRSLRINEHERGAVSFPIYPIKFVVVLGLFLLTTQFALDTVAVLLGADEEA